MVFHRILDFKTRPGFYPASIFFLVLHSLGVGGLSTIALAKEGYPPCLGKDELGLSKHSTITGNIPSVKKYCRI